MVNTPIHLFAIDAFSTTHFISNSIYTAEQTQQTLSHYIVACAVRFSAAASLSFAATGAAASAAAAAVAAGATAAAAAPVAALQA